MRWACLRRGMTQTSGQYRQLQDSASMRNSRGVARPRLATRIFKSVLAFLDCQAAAGTGWPARSTRNAPRQHTATPARCSATDGLTNGQAPRRSCRLTPTTSAHPGSAGVLRVVRQRERGKVCD